MDGNEYDGTSWCSKFWWIPTVALLVAGAALGVMFVTGVFGNQGQNNSNANSSISINNPINSTIVSPKTEVSSSPSG